MSKFSKKVEEARSLLRQHASQHKPPRILLGQKGGQPFYLEGRDLENSFHIMGATREGKSKQLQNIFRQFMIQGIGCALIDPHGYLYDELVADCSFYSSRYPDIKEKLILFDPSDDQHIVGFNTMKALPGHDLTTLVLSRMYATIKARGKDNFDDMPTAKTWLQNIFTPVITKNLSLMETKHLIDRGALQSLAAKSIVRDSGIPLIEHDWSWYANQTKRTQYEELLSSVNMLRSFVTSERMELIFGRLNKVLDLRDIMDNGRILLVNLGLRTLHKDISRLLGTLLVNEFFLAAMTRPEYSRPFYLAIDEFENYVTQDIGDILDQGSKYQLHLLLAHHSLAQMEEVNRKVHDAVMQHAKVKIIYGGLLYEDAQIMAREIYTYHGKGGLDPMKKKNVQHAPYLEPHEETRILRAEGHTDANTTGSSQDSGHVIQSGETRIPVDDMFLSERLASYLSSHSVQSSEGRHDVQSSTDSQINTLIPFVVQELKWFVSNIQYLPLDEQVHKLVERMKNLPRQVCMVKLPKEPVVTLQSNNVEEHYRLDGEIQRFSDRHNLSSPHHMTRDEAKEERARILEDLLHKPSNVNPEGSTDNDRWQE